MSIQLLDDFQEPTGWSAMACGQGRLRIRPDNGPSASAMRLDFALGDAGGRLVARRPLRRSLPASFALMMEIRAEASASGFEFRLLGAGGENLWWFRDESFDFDSGWRLLRIDSRDIRFGEGPAGGGVPVEIEAVEIAITARPGGHGCLWVADLRLEDRTLAAPLARASGACPGEEAGRVLDANPTTSWRADRLPAWVELDFQEIGDHGGLILHWDRDAPRAFRVLTSGDGSDWSCVYSAPRSVGFRSYVYLPNGLARFLRLALDGPADAPVPGLVDLEVLHESAARSIDEFFHRQAEDWPIGRFPRWLYREQSYWTVVGMPGGCAPALFNEEGLVEVERAGYAIEPLLMVDGALVTWADCTIRQGLANPPLPIPESFWIWGSLALSVTAFSVGPSGRAALYLRYRLENHGSLARSVALYVAVRPFQVSPPWQGARDVGGARRIRRIGYRNGSVRVNGRLALRPLSAPSGFGAATFDEGSITEFIAAGGLPPAREVMDPFGHASAALCFDRSIEPGGVEEIYCAVPLGERTEADLQEEQESGVPGAARLASALVQWSRVLDAVDFKLPAIARDYADACHGALAHILINRDGPALQPGPRHEARSWIRSGAVMAAALSRFGRVPEVGDYIRWYARFQSPDGHVPGCVDSQGADWRPEYDSQGQFVFIVADYLRFSGDLALARELWPAVLKAVGYLEQLRADRLTPYFRTPERRACFGLLPESVRRDGEAPRVAHLYRDDFWALRGFKDAVELAEALGDLPQAARLAVLLEEFRVCLHVSITRTMDAQGIDYLPASVEGAELDPTATASALTLIDEAHRLPVPALHRTFDRFMEAFRERHGANPTPWTHYSALDMRVIGALVRLGRRDEAHELACFFLDERRPVAWNQWPGLTWRDPRAPADQGDLPHAGIGAEYCLAFRDCLAYERESDRSLVVAAGIPSEWLDAGEVVITGLPTHYGTLDLTLRALGEDRILIRLGGELRIPPGGIQIAPPMAEPLMEVRVNGAPSRDFNATEARVRVLPAEVEVCW
ncbi:hypothetical protein [Thiocystis violacea]|uniref:hypothetical protein n=1 Tax=Thiocystis violacea TaxID=13725 RepID=UPI001907C944|nr:hypothetical protein [Thiocystis violacea]MBK1720300.1 hypothetical protein [Thiocystis violacea]